MNDEHTWWLKMAAYTGLAWIGGALGYVMRTLDKGVRPSVARAIVEASAAAFAGVLFYLACSAANFSHEMTGVIVGVSGWLGASASIRLLEPLVKKKMGVPNDQRPSVD